MNGLEQGVSGFGGMVGAYGYRVVLVYFKALVFCLAWRPYTRLTQFSISVLAILTSYGLFVLFSFPCTCIK